MVNLLPLSVIATSILTFVAGTPIAGTPTLSAEKRQESWVPGTLNNTQEFYIKMVVTDGDYTYEEWALEAYHTGAGEADPVFTNGTGSRAYLNGTNLQFDVSPYPFSINAFPSDTNYARWEPVTITSGYGSGTFINEGSAGFQNNNTEADGWVVCEWFHGQNAPQLFQMIAGFDGDGSAPYQVPSSCARVLLFPEWI